MTEAEVWEKVSSLLKEPEPLRTGIERYIKQEHRGDPEREMRVWSKRLADVDAKRFRYQDMAAEGLIDFDELRAKLVGMIASPATRVAQIVAAPAARLARVVGAYAKKSEAA